MMTTFSPILRAGCEEGVTLITFDSFTRVFQAQFLFVCVFVFFFVCVCVCVCVFVCLFVFAPVLVKHVPLHLTYSKFVYFISALICPSPFDFDLYSSMPRTRHSSAWMEMGSRFQA